MDVTSLASNEMIPVGVAIIAINFTTLYLHSKQQSKEIESLRTRDLEEIKQEQNKLERMILNERAARQELNTTIERVLTTVEFIKETLNDIKQRLK